MPHSIVLELLYILTGIALSYTFVGLHKVVVVFFSGQKVFVPYLIISFILPVIIWQHTYEISNQIEIIQRTYATRGEDFKSFFSLVSLFELVTWATLFGIIVTVFPVKEKIKYSMTSKKWKEHVKTNRRIFFLLCFAYIIEVIYCNKLLEIETGVLINLSRCMMLSACGWSFLLNFERVNKHLNYNIRIVVPKFG